MRREQWVWLPIQMGVGAVLAGFVVILALFWGSGEQVSSTTQLPFVLVAGGTGLGLVLFGAGLINAQRQRMDRHRLEDAAARMLVAAARLSRSPGSALRPPVTAAATRSTVDNIDGSAVEEA